MDTTVQPKAITFPTDAKLLHAFRDTAQTVTLYYEPTIVARLAFDLLWALSASASLHPRAGPYGAYPTILDVSGAVAGRGSVMPPRHARRPLSAAVVNPRSTTVRASLCEITTARPLAYI